MTLDEMRTLVYLGLGDTSYSGGSPSPQMPAAESVRLVLSEAALRVAMDIFRVGVTLRPKYADLTVFGGGDEDYPDLEAQQEYPLSSGVELSGDARKPTGVGDFAFLADDDYLGLLLVERMVTPGTPSTYYNCSWTEGADFRLKNKHGTPGATSPVLYLRGQRLGFTTTPTNSTDQYRIHYAPRSPALIEDDHGTDALKTTVPEEYHGVVVAAAVVDLYAAENTPNAERARVKYIELRESMLATLSTRFRQNPPLRRARRR